MFDIVCFRTWFTDQKVDYGGYTDDGRGEMEMVRQPREQDEDLPEDDTETGEQNEQEMEDVPLDNNEKQANPFQQKSANPFQKASNPFQGH